MNQIFIDAILNSTGAKDLQELEVIQSLWSSYGKIVRYELEGGMEDTVVVKHVRLPKGGKHPRGWNTDLSHQRKVKSYEVETNWYQQYAKNCEDGCRIPKCFAVEQVGDEVLMVLEDLDASGYARRKSAVNRNEIELCLKWLASFHATYMHVKPQGLWQVGTYWHLETRPDELKVLDDKILKQAAGKIDARLNEAKYLTLVHGDAKLANFCFSEDGQKVAAVDFQYVGGGCGMKDVAYFVGSCLYEEDCEKYEADILNVYFNALAEAIASRDLTIDTKLLEEEWRALYPVAWADFHRFLKGWSPGHWKINSYSEKVTRTVINSI